MEAQDLARKYRALLALRLRAAASPELSELRALAAEFPGALRELDELPRAELERRIEELDAGRWRPELRAIARFHQRVLELRALPHAHRKGRRLSHEALATLARELAIDLASAHRLVFPFARVRRL